jgi:hypothetical protein
VECGQGTPIFHQENAGIYGEFLGKRYKDAGIIWILGGDILPRTQAEIETLRAMAYGLRRGDDGRHLITYHPFGPGQSSKMFHHEPWLDFNMNQSSHGARDHDNGYFIKKDRALDPPKPTLDGEPRYEQLLVGFYYNGYTQIADRFDDFDVRQAAYWAVFSGACGHTYGNNNIWQMWEPNREPVSGANVHWCEALFHSGALQMRHLRNLMETHDFSTLSPLPELLVDGPDRSAERIVICGNDTIVLAYSPYGCAFAMDHYWVKKPCQASWFDPRYGVLYPLLKTPQDAFQTYVPPTAGRGCDWVLVLDTRSSL